MKYIMVSLGATHYPRRFLHWGGALIPQEVKCVMENISVWGLFFLLFQITTFSNRGMPQKRGNRPTAFIYLFIYFCHCCSFMVLVFVTVPELFESPLPICRHQCFYKKNQTGTEFGRLTYECCDFSVLWYYILFCTFVCLPPAFLAASVP